MQLALGDEDHLLAGMAAILAARAGHEVDGAGGQLLGADEERFHDGVGGAMDEMQRVLTPRGGHAELEFRDMGGTFLRSVPVEDSAFLGFEVIAEMPFGAAPMNGFTGLGDR